MIKYAISLAGKAHGETNCQDYSKTIELGDGWHMALIADGVGSAENAAEGSRMAVETVADFCSRYMPWDYNTVSIKSMLRTAFNFALKEIKRVADEESKPLSSFDTTLSVAIYNGRKIIYGHSGDGAIIGLNSFGEYFQITTPQNGDDGVSVIPLRAGYQFWDINECEEEVAAVLLVTDGMLSAIMPYMLRETAGGVYVPLATYFADPKGFSDEEDRTEKIHEFITGKADAETENEFYTCVGNIYAAKNLSDAENVMKEIISNNYPVSLVNDVQDDKTVAAMINTEPLLEHASAEYYMEPDWNTLREKIHAQLYPHLCVPREEEQDNPKKRITVNEIFLRLFNRNS